MTPSPVVPPNPVMTPHSGARRPPPDVKTNQDDMPGNKLSDRWRRMMDDRKERKLMKQSGEDFDETYLEMMVDEHQDTVDLFEDAIEDDDVKAKNFATKYLPVLRQHLEEAKRLEETID